jgi:hypothetical protein
MPVEIAHGVEDTRIIEQIETFGKRLSDRIVSSAIGDSLFLINAL